VSIRRPTATVTIDGQARTLPEAALAAVRIDLAFGAHDRALLASWSDGDFASVAPGDTVEIALGFGDDQEDVLSGAVEAVDALAGGIVIEVLSATSELSRARVAQGYVDQTIADIVKDLIDKAGGRAGDVDASTQLAAYHVDERRNVWSHLVDLARLAGCDLGCAADGAVNFQPPRQGGSDRTLRHGAELLRWRVGQRRALPDPLPVVPYGAASEAGKDGWHLLLRTPDGDPPSAASMIHAAVRDRDLAQSLSDARTRARDRAATGGEVLITGDAGLRPGAVVTLEDLPSGELGDLRVLAVSHLIDARHGFVTTLRTEAA
jgi:hypothetical protein